MNFFKSILSAILWTIGIIYLVVVVLYIIIASYLVKQKMYDPGLKWLSRNFMRMLLIRVKVVGKENIDPTKTYIFMGNHVSMFDIPLLLGHIPVHFRGAEASGHFKTPLYGWALKRYGNIPMDRSNPKASFKGILRGIELLKEGKNITILPEGTRSTIPGMGVFKKFPFIMAQKAGVEIIPIGMSGLWKVNNKNSWHINPGKIIFTFGKPISAETVKSMSTEDLMEYTKSKIQELILEA